MNTNNLLLGILIVAVFATGFMIGRFSTIGSTYTGVSQTTNTDAKTDVKKNADGTTATTTAHTTTGTQINAANLTDGQKKMLSAMGIDPNSITVTAQMIACAEASLGPVRVEEIKRGSTPSFTEGVKLAACYR